MIRRVVVLILFATWFTALAQTRCESLKSFASADSTVTAAESVPAGAYRPPVIAPTGVQPPPIQLPEYCRVNLILKPTADSHIEMELWMPATGWNGKLQVVGNGGWAGSISFGAMALALLEGYATSSTDTGHKGGNADFTIGHPEKVVDYAYRAVHEMTVKSKALVASFYGRGVRLSYWNGCSTGGRQGLMEAQRYPEDFDGIIAGAANNYKIHMNAWQMALPAAISRIPAGAVPVAKMALLHRAVLSSCDMLDGVNDGLLNDPLKCRFDPATLLCRNGGDGDNCLTAPQVEAVKMAYAPARMKTGEVIFPGMPPGSELGWRMLTGAAPAETALGTFRSVLYQDPKWHWRAFDLDRDTALADEKLGYMNAVDPDLKAFKARGGKLLLYHGWSDPTLSAQNSIDYYASVRAKMGQDQGSWLRLFLVPGMGHCRGGPGPNQFDAVAALERWREAGTAPDQILASHVTNNRVDMTRPLCPYPQVAVYKGVGSTNDASNFVCRAR